MWCGKIGEYECSTQKSYVLERKDGGWRKARYDAIYKQSPERKRLVCASTQPNIAHTAYTCVRCYILELQLAASDSSDNADFLLIPRVKVKRQVYYCHDWVNMYSDPEWLRAGL